MRPQRLKQSTTMQSEETESDQRTYRGNVDFGKRWVAKHQRQLSTSMPCVRTVPAVQGRAPASVRVFVLTKRDAVNEGFRSRINDVCTRNTVP